MKALSNYHRLTDSVYLVAGGDLGLSHYTDCNTYLLVAGAEAALVDAGSGYRPQELIENTRAVLGDLERLRYVLVTHAHADHSGGLAAVKEASPAQVVASTLEAELLAHGSDDATGLAIARAAGIYPPDYSIANVPADLTVEHGSTLSLGTSHITALITPGHTPGHTCYLVTGAGPRMLFSGDEVSWGGLMRLMNLPGSDLASYREGVQRLAGLQVDCLFPSHGLWSLRNGQGHIDKLIQSFRGPSLPPQPARVERIIPP